MDHVPLAKRGPSQRLTILNEVPGHKKANTHSRTITKHATDFNISLTTKLNTPADTRMTKIHWVCALVWMMIVMRSENCLAVIDNG